MNSIPELSPHLKQLRLCIFSESVTGQERSFYVAVTGAVVIREGKPCFCASTTQS